MSRITAIRTLGVALGIVVLGLLMGAATGITTQQTKTAAPTDVTLSSASNTEGTSLSHARADHVHKVSGTLADANLASNYSGVGACGANTWASTLNDNAAPTCTQPAFSNISSTLALAQLTDSGTASECLLSGGAGGDPVWGACSGGSAYATVQDEGTPLTQRNTLNFAGAGVSCADDTTRTTCTISGGGSGAPVDAEYVTYASNATLTVERVLSNGTGTTVDLGTAGQAQVDLNIMGAATLGGVKGTGTVTDCGAGFTARGFDAVGALVCQAYSPTVTGTYGSAMPADGNPSGFYAKRNGTMWYGILYDNDSGAGFEDNLGVSLRKSASGGSVELGTATDPVRTDPTGTTTQPVSGTLTCNAGTGPWPVTDNGGSLTVDGTLTSVATITNPVTVTDGAGALNVIVDSGTLTAVTSITNTVTVQGASGDNSAAGTTSTGTLPGIVETSTTPPTRTDGNRAALALDSDGKTYVRDFDWDPLSATSGLSTATALTQLIAAPGASVSIYITAWKCSSSAAATATADQQCTLKYGTGTNCGTGTTYLDGCFNPANGGCHSPFPGGPVKVPANNALCWIHAATGSKIVSVQYFLAP